MYKEVTCWNTGNTYLVTNTVNLPVGMKWYSSDEDGDYSPKYDYKESYRVNKTTSKPSVYARDKWYRYHKDEYKYAFTERKTEVITTDKDVYYNSKRDRFISKTSNKVEKEVSYGLPHLIIW